MSVHIIMQHHTQSYILIHHDTEPYLTLLTMLYHQPCRTSSFINITTHTTSCQTNIMHHRTTICINTTQHTSSCTRIHMYTHTYARKIIHDILRIPMCANEYLYIIVYTVICPCVLVVNYVNCMIICTDILLYAIMHYYVCFHILMSVDI